jgi:hypothetical protein
VKLVKVNDKNINNTISRESPFPIGNLFSQPVNRIFGLFHKGEKEDILM